MEKDHRVCISPCKQLNGKTLVSDVNRIILDVAANFDGAVVTNHDYSDIVSQKQGKRTVLLHKNSFSPLNFPFSLLGWFNVMRNIVNFQWIGDEINFVTKN